MKNVVPKDTRYMPFTQQASCCVPTSISMVMYKLEIPLVPIELLGYHGSDVLNKTRRRNGHACVIDRIYPSRDMIRLVDPSDKQAKWREFKINKFIKAIKLHPAGIGRLMELNKTKKV